MKKSHFTYLRRAVGMVNASDVKSGLLRRIEELKCAATPVYQLIRDIVCDARFYAVIGGNDFWKDYSVAVICGFIDTLSAEDWEDEEQRTGKKEEFLNTWMARHMIPFTEDEETEIARKLKTLPTGGGLMFDNTASGSARTKASEFSYGFGVHDLTDNEEPPRPDLPEEVRELLEGADESMAGLPGNWKSREGAYVASIDRTIVELARKIGRSGGSYEAARGRFQHSSKSDIAGVMTGNDLNRMLPTEVAMLSEAATERVFLRRYVTKQLQLFASSSTSFIPKAQGKGPVYICIDTSSSMAGEPELLAKRLALCIAVIAGRERRPVFLVNYSHTLSFFMISDLKMQRRRLLSFLSRSYSGGNNETLLFDFLFTKLPEAPLYKQYVSQLKGADLLIVSDFQWDAIGGETRALIERASASGMRIYSLGVNMGNPESRAGRNFKEYSEGETGSGGFGYRSGYDFFASSDSCYVAVGGRVREVLPGTGYIVFE